MQNQENVTKTSLIINRSLWEEFKIYTKLNNSDANKEMRKFVENYVKKNRKKFNK